MEFNDLELRWKIMVIMGFIFIFISVILAIFIILMFKTDVIQYINLGEKPDISEFDYLFDKETATEPELEPESEIIEIDDNVDELDIKEAEPEK